jgi:hypothetical protein
VYAGESEHGGTSTGEFEVAYNTLEIPTKLVKRVRRPSRSTVTPSNPYRRGPEDDRTPDIRYEEHTSHAVEELCDVYFEKIKDCETSHEYRPALQGLPLSLPDSNRDIGYANAFWYVNQQPLPTGYRIFYGAVKEVVQCRDGYLISYPIPGRPNNAWRPVVLHLPKNVLDEFDWGHHIERMLRQDKIDKTPHVFLCGRPNLDGQGIVIPLESVYWIHCTKHPHWRTLGYFQVSKVLQPYQEVAQRLFAQRLNEFHWKFPSGESAPSGDSNNLESLPQQEQSITQPELSPPPSFTGIVSPPAIQQESHERSSTLLDIPTNSPSPEQKLAKKEKGQSLWKRIFRWPPW